MSLGAAALFQRLLNGWTRFILHRPGRVAVGVLVLAGSSLVYAAGNLGVNTDNADMLSPELPYRQDRIRYLEAFPGSEPGFLLVLDAGTPEAAEEAARDLEERLRNDTLVISVHRPGSGAFFQRHALLYRPPEALEGGWRSLAPGTGAGPSLGDVARRPHLPSLFRYLDRALAAQGVADVRSVLQELTRGMGSTLQGGDYRASWERMLVGGGPVDRRQVLQVDPVADYDRLLPVGRAMSAVESAARAVERAYAPEVSVRITGTAALEHQELKNVSWGAGLASIFSLALVLSTLLVGLRSLALVTVTGLTLLAGLAMTGAFAALAVGQLNVISVAFAVLYIGLGVDYAIHLILRYRELLGDGLGGRDAVSEAVAEVGPSLALCALTTSLAFYAFLPTPFRGVAELGLISGTAMFIALTVTLTFIPVLLVLLPTYAPSATEVPGRRAAGIPFRRSRLIRWAALAVGVGSLLLLGKARFDYNPNNLRNPASESVSTFRDLLASEGASPWSLSHLARDSAAAQEVARNLRTLPEVDRVATVESFLPEEQERKRELLGRMAGLLESPGDGGVLRADPEETSLALLGVLDRLGAPGFSGARAADPVVGLFLRLARRLVVGLELGNAEEREEVVRRMEEGAFADLPATRERIKALAQGPGLEVADLPREVRERWIGRGGQRRVQVSARENLAREEALRSFVTRVQEVTPRVTGLPIAYLEAADAVVRSFQSAFAGALGAITLILLLALPSPRDAMYVLLPLILAGVATGGAAVLLGIPFNFANVIVLPLLFGLGVDNGIHLVSRVKRVPDHRDVLATSTSRAVVLSGLTTLFSFTSLAFTDHRGVASMGKLLAIGVALIILSTLIVLPAFLARRLEGRAPGA